MLNLCKNTDIDLRLFGCLILCFMFPGCKGDTHVPGASTVIADSLPLGVHDERIFRAQWIVGEDSQDLDTTSTSRFRVRVTRFSSGTLSVTLDTAPVGTSGRAAHFTAADSVITRGLASAEQFTQACRPLSGASGEPVALITDTVKGRFGRPRRAWLIDTARVRISEIAPDLVACSNPFPD